MKNILIQSWGRTLIGGVCWLGFLVYLGTSPFAPSWTVDLLLLAALVFVPMGLGLIEQFNTPSPLGQAAIILHLPAALLLALSFTLSPGLGAAVLTLPWLGVTALISWVGLCNIHRRGLWPVESTCADAGLVFLVVGAGWATLARGGIQPTQLGFEPIYESVAAITLIMAGLLTAGLHFRLVFRKTYPIQVRILWAISACSLTFSMILAALYGCRFFLPMAWLDIPWMRALHGSANALGFALAGLAAWTWERNRGPGETPGPRD
jgi:hypothetical protein